MPNLAVIGMRVVTCSCGITWAAPGEWFKEREDTHKTFYCPNGCRRHFPQENKEEKLKRLLESKTECCLRAEKAVESIERTAIAYKGHVTRLKKKLKAI